MMYEEFNRISGGQKADINMYDKEIEPLYMTIEHLTKKEIAVMYWGTKKGAYALWNRGTVLTKEKAFLDQMINNMKNSGIRDIDAEQYLINQWNQRVIEYVKDVKKLNIKD